MSSTLAQRQKWIKKNKRRSAYRKEYEKNRWIKDKERIKARRKKVYDSKKETARAKKYKDRNPEKEKERRKLQRERLIDSYVCGCHSMRGINISHELIEFKRAHIQLIRAIRQHERTGN